MKQFHLEIVSPEGKVFEGDITRLVTDTPGGPVCIMAGHIDYCTQSSGNVRIVTEKEQRHAHCGDGILTVTHGKAVLVTESFEWA